MLPELGEAMELALTLADAVGPLSRRLQQLRASILPAEEQRELLNTLFLRKARVPNTMIAHIRAVCRLNAWSQAKGFNPWKLVPAELAFSCETQATANSQCRICYLQA